jgi:hypothetical protein
MSLLPVNESEHLLSIRASASRSSRYPSRTIHCLGAAMFRTPDAHAFGCLLDLETDVLSWSCLPFVVVNDGELHVPDFVVQRVDGDFLVDVVVSENTQLPSWVAGAAARRGYSHFTVVKSDLIAKSVRIANAKDLLRYARWTTPLGDRLRAPPPGVPALSIVADECRRPGVALFRKSYKFPVDNRREPLSV